jgi:hypothetical protein
MLRSRTAELEHPFSRRHVISPDSTQRSEAHRPPHVGATHASPGPVRSPRVPVVRRSSCCTASALCQVGGTPPDLHRGDGIACRALAVARQCLIATLAIHRFAPPNGCPRPAGRGAGGEAPRRSPKEVPQGGPPRRSPKEVPQGGPPRRSPISAALARDPDYLNPPTVPAHDNGARSSPATASAGAPIPLRFHPDGPAAAHLRRQHLQDETFSLACKGCRTPEIAQRLHVSERTVRAWLRQMRQELAAEHPAFDRAGQLLLAVEALREVLQAVWQAFEEDRAAQVALLAGQFDYLRQRVVTSGRSDPTGNTQHIAEDYARPHFTSHAPTHLRLALKTQVEIARLLGLYDRGVRDQPARLPEAAAPQDAIPAKTAIPPPHPVGASGRAPAGPTGHMPEAKSPVGLSRPQGERPWGRHPRAAMPNAAATATPPTPSPTPLPSAPSVVLSATPAETAIPVAQRRHARPMTPLSSQGEGPGVRPPFPAQTATPSSPSETPLPSVPSSRPGLPAGLQPAAPARHSPALPNSVKLCANSAPSALQSASASSGLKPAPSGKRKPSARKPSARKPSHRKPSHRKPPRVTVAPARTRPAHEGLGTGGPALGHRAQHVLPATAR